MTASTSESAVQLLLSPRQVRDMTSLLFARMGQLRDRMETEITDGEEDEIRARVRVIGEFTNAINGATTTDPETGLPVHTYDPADAADRRRLREELEGLYGIVRPGDATTGFTTTRDAESVALDLAGWAHRADENPLDSDIFFTDPTGY